MRMLQLGMVLRFQTDYMIRNHCRKTRNLSFVAYPKLNQLQNSQQQLSVLNTSAWANKVRTCSPTKTYHGVSTELFHSIVPCLSRELNIPAAKPSEITDSEYEICVEETLDSLTEFFEDLPENEPCNDDYDCAYGSGVLTVHLGSIEGTYVINKQSPNKQIWLSSPLSGPKRYVYFDGQWVYLRDGRGLHRLLEEELTEITGIKVDLKNCKYYSWGIPDAK